MRRFLPSALLVAFLLSTGPAAAQTKSEAIDRLIESYAAERQFNGSILVAEKGKVIYSRGVGLANIEWNIPDTPSTRYRLASISKQFTAMLILQLSQEGKLDLDETAATYLPEWPGPQGKKITIHHLLTHTSGLPNRSGDTNIERQLRLSTTPEALLARFQGLPLAFEPGSRFEYSNTGYVALGLIIEKLTGLPYEQVVRQRIFEPLGMKSSGYETSTAIIPERHRKMMFSPMVTSDNGGGYGYGWAINRAAIGPNRDSVLLVAHSGGLLGFTSLLTRMVDREHLIVLLDNRTPGAAPLERITRGIATILYDGQPDPPLRSIGTFLYRTIVDEGLDAAARKYSELKKGRRGEYNLAEGEFNSLGYELLKEGRTAEAIAVFTWNVASFPDAPNTYDSLGEAHMIAGNRDEALASYARALHMKPANSNAAEMLKKLSRK